MASTGSAQRRRVEQLAATRVEEAIALARGIADPWFRCQALAHVAHLHARGRAALLKEAFAAADAVEGVNRRVTVASWPLAVLCQTDSAALPARVRPLLALARSEPSPVQRADALNYLLGALIGAPQRIFREVLVALREACCSPLESGKPNQKGSSHLEQWAVITQVMDPALSSELLALLGAPAQARARSRIEGLQGETAAQLCSWPAVGGRGSGG